MGSGAEADELAYAPALVDRAQAVFDVFAFLAETPRIRRALAAGKQVITGAQVIALQAAAQFVLYAGERPTAYQIAWASELARAGSQREVGESD